MLTHSDGEAPFLLICEKMIFIKKTWNHHLFLFYFLKGKQNKKENYVWLGKDMSTKTESGSEDQVQRHDYKNRVWIWRLGYLSGMYDSKP